jgi:hypothetical protein
MAAGTVSAVKRFKGSLAGILLQSESAETRSSGRARPLILQAIEKRGVEPKKPDNF